MVENAQLPEPAKNKLRFFTRQVIDAAAPANFAPTNPEVIKLPPRPTVKASRAASST